MTLVSRGLPGFPGSLSQYPIVLLLLKISIRAIRWYQFSSGNNSLQFGLETFGSWNGAFTRRVLAEALSVTINDHPSAQRSCDKGGLLQRLFSFRVKWHSFLKRILELRPRPDLILKRVFHLQPHDGSETSGRAAGGGRRGGGGMASLLPGAGGTHQR